MQGGGSRRSGATSTDDNAADEGCRKQIAQAVDEAVDEQFLSSHSCNCIVYKDETKKEVTL